MMTSSEINLLTLATILKYSQDGIFVIDRDRRCVLFSDACEKITGYRRSTVVGAQCRCHDITSCKDEYGRSLSGVLCPGIHVLEGILTYARQRMHIQHLDGQQIDIETSYSPIRNEKNEITHVIGIMRNLSDIAENDKALREVSRKLESPPTVTIEKTVSISSKEVSLKSTGTSPSHQPLDQMLALIEKHEILAALQRSKNQRTLAARDLGISRSRLYRRMEALGIDPNNIKSEG